MKTIKTESFELAIYARGDQAASQLAIVIPGRLDTKDYIHMQSLVDDLASEGFFALSFDPPGTWESPGGIELHTTTNIHKAIHEVIEYYGNRPTVLVGHSRGGSHAMLTGTTNPHVTHFVAIMSHAGPTNIGLPKSGEEYVTSTRDLPPGTERTKERKVFKLPAYYFEDQQQYDATLALKTCIKPKLFFYGTEDVLVREATIRATYEVSADPKKIREVKTEHDYRLHPEVIKQVNKTIKNFLKE